MKTLCYRLFIAALLLPLATLVRASACDGSLIIIRNNTKTHFSVPDYSPRSGTSLTLLRGPAEIPPGGDLRFKVHSGSLSWGESFGVIKIQGLNRQYDLFYMFGSFFGYGDCTVRYEISTSQMPPNPEKYLIGCEDGVTKSPATLICTINLPKYSLHPNR